MSANPRVRSLAAGFSLLLLAAGLLFPPPSAARDNEVRLLTLPEALRIASERNRDIRKAMELRRQLEGRYAEERAAALPQLQITASASRAMDESQGAFGDGLLPVRQDAWGAEAGLSQALFTWGQVGAAIRAAKIGLATAEDQLRLFRQATERDVTASFYDVLLARELHAIAAENLEQKVRHLDEARKKYAAGTATDYDVLAAEVAAENARPAVLRTENRVRLSRERLRFLLGIGPEEVDVQGTMDAPIDPYPDYRQTVETAWSNRPELSDLRHRLGVAEELVTIANAGDKPRLDFRAGYGWRELDVGESDASGAAWSAGLFVTYPFFDGLRTRGKVAQARSDVRSLRIDEAKLLDSVAVQAREAVDQVRESGEIVKALSGTVSQAARLLFMAEKGFEFGVKTRLEVEDAELNLTQAKGNLALARRDYLVSRVTLEFVKGTLGEDRETGSGREEPWRPADNVPGLILEVLSGNPKLR